MLNDDNGNNCRKLTTIEKQNFVESRADTGFHFVRSFG